MRITYPGHGYWLANLKAPGEQRLQFYQDGERHPPVPGTSCQEVLRALIDRVEVLDEELPWEGNQRILSHLREALLEFEIRALSRKVHKGLVAIEHLALGDDGHILLQSTRPAGPPVQPSTRGTPE